MHAVVARSTFPSQKCQKPTVSDHFWKLRRRTSARRCGAKHISKSKCTKHTMPGPLLEVQLSKKCAVVARSTFPSQNVQSTPTSNDFWKVRCRKVDAVVARSTFPSQKCKRLRGSDHFLTFQMSKKCAPLWRKAHCQVKSVKN